MNEIGHFQINITLINFKFIQQPLHEYDELDVQKYVNNENKTFLQFFIFFS